MQVTEQIKQSQPFLLYLGFIMVQDIIKFQNLKNLEFLKWIIKIFSHYFDLNIN